MAVPFKITTKGIPEVQALLKKFTGPEVKRTLHERWGIQAMNWVDQNFRQQGALTGSPWAALKPSTIAARRSPKKSSKKSAADQAKLAPKILQDSGRLKQSFVMRFDENETSIGSPVFYGAYHEEGRKGPWAIRPKKAGGVLAWKGIDKKMVFAKSVQHPGLPQRRMLPRQTDETFMEKLKLVATNLFNELSGK